MKIDGCHRISAERDPDCGCIEEEWSTPAGYMSFHLLPSGTAEVFFDNGDAGEWETVITGQDEAEFRNNLSDYIRSLG